MKEKIPETELELEDWMKQNCYNFNSYSINGNLIWEGLGIEKKGPLYSWYHIERGQKSDLEIFRTEKEVVEFAFKQIKSDKWAMTHCVGFQFDKGKSKELEQILTKLDIEFIQDEIPYSWKGLAYRVFVLGCDIKRTEHLKEVFYDKSRH